MSANSRVVLTLSPASTDYEQDDPEFVRQVVLLAGELRAAGVDLLETPASGKGDFLDLAQLLVAGGAGLGTILGVVRTWILHRGHRSVDISYDSGGAQQSIRLDATNVSEQALVELAAKIASGNSPRE